jgi:hypothetical protein
MKEAAGNHSQVDAERSEAQRFATLVGLLPAQARDRPNLKYRVDSIDP